MSQGITHGNSLFLRSALYGKLAGPLFRSLESATAFAKLRSNPWVELTHWLHQLTQQPDNDILHVLRHYQIPLSDVEKALPGNWILCYSP